MSRKSGLRAAPLRVIPATALEGARTPLDYLHLYWRHVDPADRLAFLCEMLTPNERRAIQLGLDIEEVPDGP